MLSETDNIQKESYIFVHFKYTKNIVTAWEMGTSFIIEFCASLNDQQWINLSST